MSRGAPEGSEPPAKHAEAPPGARGPSPGAGATGHGLELPEAVAREMARAAEEGYPREACGALLGSVEDDLRRVEAHHPVANRWADRDDRYIVDPATLRRLMEDEERGGPRVLGFYHSHPDAPPEPSATDLEHAWPWYVYLIVPVEGDEGGPRAGRGRAWELDPARGAFTEVDVSVGGARAQPGPPLGERKGGRDGAPDRAPERRGR